MTRALLSDVTTILMGQSPPSTTYNILGQGLPFFQGKADFGELFPSVRLYCSRPLRIAQPGDILLSVRAPVGPTNVSNAQACIGRGLAAIRAGCLLHQPYLRHFLRYYEPTLALSGQGSTFDAINRDDLEAIPILVPPLTDQQRIAAILDKADRLRRLRQFALQQSETFLQSVFFEMFGDPVINPRRWPTSQLGELGQLDRGRSKHRPRNAPELLGGVYPFVQTGDVANSEGYIRRYRQTYSDLGLSQSKMWSAGTLCITIAANIAKTGILTFDACFPDSVVGFKPYTQVTIEYIQIWLSFLQSTLEATAPESAQKNINLEILNGISTMKPPMPMQQKFSAVVTQVERLREQQREAVRQADHLFQKLLHQAFNGDL